MILFLKKCYCLIFCGKSNQRRCIVGRQPCRFEITAPSLRWGQDVWKQGQLIFPSTPCPAIALCDGGFPAVLAVKLRPCSTLHPPIANKPYSSFANQTCGGVSRGGNRAARNPSTDWSRPVQILLKNHNFCDIFYTSLECSFRPLCLNFTKFGRLPVLFRLIFFVENFHHFLQIRPRIPLG